MKRLLFIVFCLLSIISLPLGAYATSAPIEYIPNFIYIILGFLTLKLHKKLELWILILAISMFFWAVYDRASTDTAIWGLMVVTYLIDQKEKVISMFNLPKFFTYMNTPHKLKSHTSLRHKLNLNDLAVVILTFGLILLAYSISRASYLEVNQTKKESLPTPISSAIDIVPSLRSSSSPDSEQTPQPTPKPTNIDGKIDCSIHSNCGGNSIRLTKAECDLTTCCQVNNTWSFYRDKNRCKVDQQASIPKTSVSSTYTQTQFPPCTVYYSLLGYSQTYTYMNTDECNDAKESANSVTTPVGLTEDNSTEETPSDIVSCNGQYSYFGEKSFTDCCVAICNEAYEISKRSTIAQYGGTTGTADFIIKTQIEPDYQSCLSSCY